MPHESLNILHLAKLPQALCVRAKRAADGSLEDLASVLMQIWDLPEERYGLALPLLFVHLDPAAIPSPAEFDDILSREGQHHEFNPIIAATMALHMISRLLYVSKIPPAAYVDLWTRLYPWILFDSIHWDYIPDHLRSSFLSSWHLEIIPVPSNIIRTSPGVRAILVRYWAALVRNDAIQTDAWHDMCSILVFLTEDGARAAKYLEEMADGVDGSQADLACLLVKQMNDASACPTSDEAIMTLTCALGLVTIGSAATEHFKRGDANHQDIAPSAAVGLGLIVARLQSHSGQQWITEALDGDLLGLILALGLTARPMRTSTPEDCFPLLKKLLRNIIPGYLVYHPVALRMKRHFPNAVSLAASPAFKKSAVFGLWKEFATLVEQNLTALDLFESKQYMSSKVCENVKNARRLIGVHDIENGATSLHRPTSPGPSSPRDRSYLRALLQHHFRLVLKPEILVRQAEFIYHNPGVDFFTIFDFTHSEDGSSWIDVRPISEYAKAPEAPLRMAQLKRSGRRMQLHTVIMNGGPVPFLRMFPMWSDSSRLLDGLFHVVNALPPGRNFSDTDVYQMAVRRLRDLSLECEAARVVEMSKLIDISGASTSNRRIALGVTVP
ncbi:hypothetical protein B0H14DRAFT_2611206 [Mycena olivaceomarginata]|nr:hypothetical protein B0H14DRAFT_2611206 [Mycena olivaceomarginata]